MARQFKKPCLVCGQLTDGGNRCELHEAQYRKKRNERLDELERSEKKKRKYNYQYQKKAKQLRELARLVPTKCHICGEIIRSNESIDIDHLVPELDNLSPLAPTHSICNRKRGNKPLT